MASAKQSSVTKKLKDVAKKTPKLSDMVSIIKQLKSKVSLLVRQQKDLLNIQKEQEKHIEVVSNSLIALTEALNLTKQKIETVEGKTNEALNLSNTLWDRMNPSVGKEPSSGSLKSPLAQMSEAGSQALVVSKMRSKFWSTALAQL